MAHGNNFLATGYGSTRQWLAPFQLLDDTGAVMFAVASDGTLTTTSNQVVANPGNFKATGTGEIDGNFSIGDAFGGSPTFKITAASGNTAVSGTLAVTGASTLSSTLGVTGALTVTAVKPILGASANTPASASAAGTAGMVCWDSGFIYVCTATNTWKSVAIATF